MARHRISTASTGTESMRWFSYILFEISVDKHVVPWHSLLHYKYNCQILAISFSNIFSKLLFEYLSSHFTTNRKFSVTTSLEHFQFVVCVSLYTVSWTAILERDFITLRRHFFANETNSFTAQPCNAENRNKIVHAKREVFPGFCMHQTTFSKMK